VRAGEFTPLRQPIIYDVMHDPDNRRPLRRLAEFFEEGQLMANWIGIREPFARGCVVDQNHALAIFVIGDRKIAPA